MQIIKTFLLCIMLIVGNDLYAQSFQGRNNKPVKLEIKFPPPDSIKPEISLQLPKVLDGFPIYVKDSIFILNGIVSDNSGKSKIIIDNKDYGVFQSGPFSIPISLLYGENKLNIQVVDRSENLTEKNIMLFQDPKADNTPPTIKLYSPFDELTRGIQIVPKENQDSVIFLKGQVIDESNIHSIIVNDQRVDSIIGSEFYFTFKYGMPDSLKIIAADVFGNIGEISSRVETRIVEDIETDINSIKFYALLIGIDEYADPRINDLDYPVSDCLNLSTVLNDHYLFNRADIKILKNPTRREIISTLEQLRTQLTENSNLLIFYAGHGYFDDEIQQGYWLPSDAKKEESFDWLSNNTIRDYIRGIKTQHTLLISDACFSGSILRDPLLDASISINEIYKSKSRKAMVSGIVNEVPDKSVFVKYLMEGLINNQKKYLPAQDLYFNIKDAVIRNSQIGQIPSYSYIPSAGDEGLSGDFIFIKRK
jgi:hypothetical protein